MNGNDGMSQRGINDYGSLLGDTQLSGQLRVNPTRITILKDLDERITWLENQLKNHNDWSYELSQLKKMREAGK